MGEGCAASGPPQVALKSDQGGDGAWNSLWEFRTIAVACFCP
jgi:hypothetical protein